MTNTKITAVKSSQLSPNAFWLSFIPVFGSLAIVREGNRLRDNKFAQLGWLILGLSIVLALVDGLFVAWLLQIGVSFWFRNQYINVPEPIIQVDFNRCSKHDLVRVLDLPIVYANDIDLIRNEGYLFTHAEELTEIAGVPEEQVRRIAPRLIFSYSAMQDEGASWRRVNFLSADEMQTWGIAPEVAQKIVEERVQRGDYRSAVAVKTRTGIPFRDYKRLV